MAGSKLNVQKMVRKFSKIMESVDIELLATWFDKIPEKDRAKFKEYCDLSGIYYYEASRLASETKAEALEIFTQMEPEFQATTKLRNLMEVQLAKRIVFSEGQCLYQDSLVAYSLFESLWFVKMKTYKAGKDTNEDTHTYLNGIIPLREAFIESLIAAKYYEKAWQVTLACWKDLKAESEQVKNTKWTRTHITKAVVNLRDISRLRKTFDGLPLDVCLIKELDKIKLSVVDKIRLRKWRKLILT